MALWRCTACTTAYSVGAPSCPHCGSTDHQEDGMPKISGDQVSYDGHVDTSPEDVAEPEWAATAGDEVVEDQVAEEPAPEPAPRKRTRKA